MVAGERARGRREKEKKIAAFGVDFGWACVLKSLSFYLFLSFFFFFCCFGFLVLVGLTLIPSLSLALLLQLEGRGGGGERGEFSLDR